MYNDYFSSFCTDYMKQYDVYNLIFIENNLYLITSI